MEGSWRSRIFTSNFEINYLLEAEVVVNNNEKVK
jgi:hypothetical protein